MDERWPREGCGGGDERGQIIATDCDGSNGELSPFPLVASSHGHFLYFSDCATSFWFVIIIIIQQLSLGNNVQRFVTDVRVKVQMHL